MARLLICNKCKTVDRLPDYNREADLEAKYDYALQDAVDLHLRKYGSDPNRHPSILADIPDRELDLIDPEQLQKAVHDDELERFLKENRENYKEDAMRCFNLHGRPKGGCIDWCQDSRAIGVTVGKAKEDKQYLCYFCPVATHVATVMRMEAGLYK